MPGGAFLRALGRYHSREKRGKRAESSLDRPAIPCLKGPLRTNPIGKAFNDPGPEGDDGGRSARFRRAAFRHE